MIKNQCAYGENKKDFYFQTKNRCPLLQPLNSLREEYLNVKYVACKH